MAAMDRSEATEASCSSRRIVGRAGKFVAMLDEQPVVPLTPVLVVSHPHQHPAAAQAFAVELEFQISVSEHVLRGTVPHRLPSSPVPELHGARAVLTGSDGALEVAIFQRVILDLNGEPLIGWIQRWSLGYRPGLEYAVEFQPQVVMQPGGRVLLHYKSQPRRWGNPYIAAGLRGFLEVALRAILGEL